MSTNPRQREPHNRPTRRHRSPLLRCLFLFLLIFASFGAGSSQADGPRFQFTKLSIDQGLSQSTVNCIFQDSSGFLWICTQNGLNQYDGYEITIYRPDNHLLPHDWISTITEDADGALWIGTEGGGLTRWNRRTDEIRHFKHSAEDPTSLGSDRVRTLTIDSQENLWIGTMDAGISVLDAGAETFRRFRHDPDTPHSLRHDEIRSVVESRRGGFWIGTLSGLDYFDLDSGTFEHVDLIHPSAVDREETKIEVQAVLEAVDGTVWIGTQEGLAVFPSPDQPPMWHLSSDAPGTLSHDWIRSLFQDNEERIWVGTENGLNLWSPETRSFSTIHTRDRSEQAQGQIFSITQDRNGNLWLGTFQEGALKWNPRSLSFQPYEGRPGSESDSGNNIFAIAEDRSGDLWLGTFAGVSHLERQTLKYRHFQHDPEDPSSLSDDRVTAVLVDSKAQVWAGTFAGGLNQIDPQRGVIRHYRHDPEDPKSLGADGVTSVFEDSTGRLWAGTYGGGLNRMTADDAFERFQADGLPGSLSNDRIFSITEGERGELWLATDGGGLNRFRPDKGTFAHWQHDEGDPHSLGSNEIYTLHHDARGRLWIGTKSSGLDQLVSLDGDRATFKHFTEEDGLPDPTIWGIESDSQGQIWLGTTNGLVRFDTESGEFRTYDPSHGLRSREFNLGAHFASPSGELFFGGVNGLNAFFPEQIRDSTVAPTVALTGFTKLNEQVDLGVPLNAVQHLDLDHSDHFLTFEFAALDFTAPEKNRYRYQLGGFEAEDRWVDMSDRRLEFASLSPGKYTLRVQGSNSDGAWSPVGKEITIDVAPPLWRTWWFRSLLLLFAAATATGAHQLKIHRIRVNNERLAALVKERTRELEDAQEKLVRKEKLAVLGELSGSVAHELRNPLGIIKNSIYFLRLTQKMVDDKAKEHLSLIDREIKRSDRIIGELLDYAKEPTAQTEPVTATQIIDASLELLEIPDGIELVYDPDGFRDDDGDWLLQVDQGQIERVLGNLITNAFQAMPEGGRLTLDGDADRQEVRLRIRDTGVGIEEDDLKKIFEPLFTRKIYGIGLGLPLSLRYVQMNNGSLDCESQVGEGTTFHLHLPRAAVETPAPSS